ncbi:MAG: glycerol acyltransferase, partial [Bacteroidota bacterium]|nr:glycerol acyltransferase [Bacteroidota bacterium]
DVPRIELYHYSVNLSQYIRFLITEQKESVWLAQREGRTKDGDDKTQAAVLKMLNLSGANSLFEDIKELNIIPVSISYEFEPMASAKVQESYDRKINPNYEKEKLDDLNSMDGGIEKKKGHIHYHFGTPLNDTLHKIEHITNRKEKYAALTELLNKEIHKNYRLTSFNYVAADIYFKTEEYSMYYTSEEKTTFENYFEKSISEINGEEDVIRQMFLKIYATPVKNYFNSIEK